MIAKRLRSMAGTLLVVACGSGTGPGDSLPESGKAAYTIAYVGGSIDTTFRNNGNAILCSAGSVYLESYASQEGGKSGFISFGRSDLQPLVVGDYPVVGTGGDSLGTVQAFTIFNGYSSEITGTMAIVTSTAREIAGTFDFSAPTEGQTPNFTVRIRGSFRATSVDPNSVCH
jgi:hypothetical protein